MTVAALRVSGAVLLVFILLTITFILLAIGASGGHTSATHWGGYLGVATAIVAWYTSFARRHQQHLREDRRTDLPAQQVGTRGARFRGVSRRAAAAPPVRLDQQVR